MIVDLDCACPKCGERNTDRLLLDDGGSLVLCENCDDWYVLPDSFQAVIARKLFKT